MRATALFGVTRFLGITVALLASAPSVVVPSGTTDELNVQAVMADVAEALNEGDTAKAERIQLSILAAAERIAKKNPAFSGGLFGLVGQFYLDQNRLTEAEPYLRRAVGLLNQGRVAEGPQMALVLLALGQVCSERGGYAEAEQHLGRARALAEKGLGADHPLARRITYEHSRALFYQDKFDEAGTVLARLVEAAERLGETASPNYAATIDNLGGIQTARGQYAQAEQTHRRAAALFEKALGPNDPAVAQSLNNLANALAGEGKDEEAEAAYRRSVDALEKTVGPDDVRLAQSLQAQADHYRKRGKLPEAEATARRALGIREKSLGPRSPLTLKTMAVVARICAEAAKFDEARTLMDNAIEISTAASGRDADSTGELMRLREQLAAKAPGGTGPVGLARSFPIVFRPGGASAGDLPPAPEGFAWERLKEIRGAFLRPAGWHFLHEERGSTQAWFVSAEEIRGEKGQFDTGLSLNAIKLQKGRAESAAVRTLGGLSSKHEVLISWSSEQEPLKIFGVLLRDRTRSDGVPLPAQHLFIVNSKTNVLYMIGFESPESQWAEAWKKGEMMMTTFVLDEEF